MKITNNSQMVDDSNSKYNTTLSVLIHGSLLWITFVVPSVNLIIIVHKYCYLPTQYILS